LNYRREIDGLRALAVLPVILFHAGFDYFSGGFVGVDIFFVISGYLITSIILIQIKKGTFSIADFYERRARRILPVLFFIMIVSSIFGYFWMMPDEFKNYGQSLVATSLFSNNILLAITTGYWDLTSEFKPLLHTWSLGVEEQYYVLFPFLLVFSWKYFRGKEVNIIASITALSFLLANWGVIHAPIITFYSLPTRAWEILLGSLVAFYLQKTQINSKNKSKAQYVSILGFLLIILSILFFKKEVSSSAFLIFIPALGAILIIIYASKGTAINSLLSSKFMVGIGMISYSLYLWHQPLLAFSRIYSTGKPSHTLTLSLIIISFIFAGLTWKFIEQPFREKNLINKKVIFISFFSISIFFILFGYYLNQNYGMAYRVFDLDTKIQNMDKRIYNEKNFSFKKTNFSHGNKLKILVIGNSFGRDFINMTKETFDMSNIDIVYRDDMSDCILPYKNNLSQNLFESANVIIFSSQFNKGCVGADILFAENHHKRLFYIGSKYFGYNLNWLIRLNKKDRPNQYNLLLKETVDQELYISSSIPKDNYISLLSPIIKGNYIPITDNDGHMLSSDRAHLTKYGAIFIGKNSLLQSKYGELLINKKNVSK
jgi:peptidoglycan/LPS O-acetylase OafA/YrhL